MGAIDEVGEGDLMNRSMLWYISLCPFCGKPVRGEEWLKGLHLCEGLRKAIEKIKEMG